MDQKIREYLSQIARKGGRTRWQRSTMTRKERSEMMKRVRRGEKIKQSPD